jgi:hypothetical protein
VHGRCCGALRRPGARRCHGWTAAVLADGEADGTAFGFADALAVGDGEADALPLGDGEADARGDATGDGDALALDGVDGLGDGSSANEPDGWGTAVGAAPGAGVKRRIPPRTSAAAAIPVSRPATIDSRGHMLARRVPVPTCRGRSARASDTMRLRWPDRPMSSVLACFPPC